MLLLMLLGAGSQAPVVHGERAYANTTYRTVTGGNTAETSVTAAGASVGAVTSAETTED
jgi:hypothetical protein